jgi:hypothetical protein
VRPGASVPIADAFVAANSPYSRQFSASNILSVHGAGEGRADVVGFVARLNRWAHTWAGMLRATNSRHGFQRFFDLCRTPPSHDELRVRRNDGVRVLEPQIGLERSLFQPVFDCGEETSGIGAVD